MNIFLLAKNPKKCARMHSNIHIVKMILETAQLLCNVHRRQREYCLPPYVAKNRIPYKESAAGHRKLGSMVWVAESLGNYRWAVKLGMELCAEYNRGRARAAGKTSKHKTQKVMEWLQRNEPNFKKKRFIPMRKKHLAMPDKLKKAATSIEAYRDYYFSKRKTMEMVWDPKQPPDWWEERRTKGKKKTSVDPSNAKGKKQSQKAVLPLAGGVTGAPKKRPAQGGTDAPTKRIKRKTTVEKDLDKSTNQIVVETDPDKSGSKTIVETALDKPVEKDLDKSANQIVVETDLAKSGSKSIVETDLDKP